MIALTIKNVLLLLMLLVTLIIVVFVVLNYCIKNEIALSYIPIPSNYAYVLPSLPCKANIRQNIDRLYREGVACGLGKMPLMLCDKVKKDIIHWDSIADSTMYGNINTRKGRSDLYIPLEGARLEIVKRLLLSWKTQSLPLYNENATITEVSSLITYPGAIGQRIHEDTVDTIRYKDAISFGIFLHDVDKTLAPLVAKANNGLFPWWYCLTGKKGEVYAWCSKVEHGGGANFSKLTRYLFYISIVYPPLRKIEVGEYSLLPIYGNGIRVGNII